MISKAPQSWQNYCLHIPKFAFIIMIKKQILFIFLLLGTFTTFAQAVKNNGEPVFKVGERLDYRLRYGFITAAEASIRVEETNAQFDNNPVFHLIAEGRTAGSFNVFYKVRNRYDSYVDKNTMAPYLYTENIREANYRRNDKARFYQDEKKVVSNNGTFRAKGQIFDVVSAYYFARNLNIKTLKEGDSFSLDYFLHDGISKMNIQYVGKEVVKTSLGYLRCIKFSPSIQPGRVFRKNSKLYLWITDDANRIPVKAHVEILVGSVTLDLINAEGLKYPLGTAKK